VDLLPPPAALVLGPASPSNSFITENGSSASTPSGSELLWDEVETAGEGSVNSDGLCVDESD